MAPDQYLSHQEAALGVCGIGLQHELLLRPMGNTVYFMPPYIISGDEMQLLVTRTLNIIDALT